LANYSNSGTAHTKTMLYPYNFEIEKNNWLQNLWLKNNIIIALI